MRLATLLPALAVLAAIVAPGRADAQSVQLRYGVATFGDVEPLRDVATLAACGYDYIEPGLAKTLALPEAERQAQLRRMSATSVRIETMNWFLPGSDIKLTGPAVDQARVNDFLERSLSLADTLGAKVIVFGSPGARSYPEGFPREQAWEQLKTFLRTAGGIIEARGYGMVIGIEPLRKPESNIINTVVEAARLAREVNHAKVRIIVDFYHLAFENEDPDVILDARDLIVHLQIADPAVRGFPKQEGSEVRYRRFFDNLRKIGYQGRISIEANSSDVAGDCGPALKFLKGMAAAAQAEAPARAPVLAQRADGLWDASGAAPGTVLRYTLDGTDPTRAAGAWIAPVTVPPGYVLKVQAFTADGKAVSEIARRESPLPEGATRMSSALVPVTQNRDWQVYDWQERHAAAVALMRERHPEIVMIGDSITNFWGGEPAGGRRNGPEQWDRLFAGRRVVNLGYGWDRTENVLWRLTHGEVDDVAPAVAVVLIGTNNIGRNTPDEIASGVEAICSTIHARSPQARILLLALLPRGERPNPARDTVGEVNRRLAALEGRHGITYLDIGPAFVSPDGTISKELMYDFLHPSAKGYEVWASAMSATLERLLQPVSQGVRP